MKNIWIDGFEANQLQRVGSGQVGVELLRSIEKLDHTNNYIVLLASSPLPDLPKEREGFRYKILKPNKLKTFLAIPLAVLRSKEKPDVIFSPTHYIPRFTKIKRVAMIFDLSFLHFPLMFNKKDLYQLKNWTKYSVENANHLITISQFSKRDIIKSYGVDKRKITVAYPGYNSDQFYPIQSQEKIQKVLKKYQIDFPYILYTGTIQPRKNLVKLIQAFIKIEGMKLVLAGKYSGLGRQAWMSEEILEAPKKFGIEDKVIFTNFVPAEELPLLMNGAVAYILPSLWEGFGIPPLEAMACGTPVIVSNVSSLPEVVGDAGLLINPESVDQIEQAIRLISTDKKLHDKLSKRSLDRAKKFSYKKMAKEVIKILEEV
jgi:glycosyltransferase involved in cell wall biosynthesis